MAIFNPFRTKEDKKLEKLRLKAAYLAEKAKILRAKNAILTSKSNFENKQITKQIDKINNLAELRTFIEQEMPTQKHWALQLLENPQVQTIVTSFLGKSGGVEIGDREKRIGDLLSQIPPEVINQAITALKGKK